MCQDHPSLAWMQWPWLTQSSLHSRDTWGLKCCHETSLLTLGINDCVHFYFKSHTVLVLLHSAWHYKHLWSLSHKHTCHTGNLRESTQTAASSQISLAHANVSPRWEACLYLCDTHWYYLRGLSGVWISRPQTRHLQLTLNNIPGKGLSVRLLTGLQYLFMATRWLMRLGLKRAGCLGREKMGSAIGNMWTSWDDVTASSFKRSDKLDNSIQEKRVLYVEMRRQEAGNWHSKLQKYLWMKSVPCPSLINTGGTVERSQELLMAESVNAPEKGCSTTVQNTQELQMTRFRLTFCLYWHPNLLE